MKRSAFAPRVTALHVLARALAGVTCGSLVFVSACSRSSPTAAAASPTNHVFGLITDGARRPLAGATVRVLDSPLAGSTLTSNPSGRFELYGTATGSVTLHVSHEGFKSVTYTAQWQPAIQGGVDSIRLESLEPSVAQLDPGAYTVTISMDLATARDAGGRSCAGFPAGLTSSSYNATVKETTYGADRAVSLEGPTVFANSGIDLYIGGQFVAFELESPFTAELSGFRYVNVFGVAPTAEPVTVSGNAVTVPFHATFQYCELTSPTRLGWESCQHVAAEQVVKFYACSSNSARMVFTKR